jgi:hypothetical protein
MRPLVVILGVILFSTLPARGASDPATLQKLMEDTLAAVKAGQDKVAALLKPLVLPNALVETRVAFLVSHAHHQAYDERRETSRRLS